MGREGDEGESVHELPKEFNGQQTAAGPSAVAGLGALYASR